MEEEKYSDKKDVDESWKDAARKEKERYDRPDDMDAEHMPPLEANFALLISGLAMQALLSLGRLPYSEGEAPEINLAQAKYLIDTIALLREKTEGNLSADEIALIDGTLYDLRMQYVEASDGGDGQKHEQTSSS
ncbi:MAG: DUF1844 domain-containing protein [Candidatus Omnitrophica bacterium]|nr:DUF1844 domain-containing protein [Candidatus Omnitrophota bacterium]